MLTIGAFFHTLDGKIFTIYGDLAVRFYGLTYVVGFVLAWFILWRLARRGLIAIPADRVPDFMLAVVLGTLLGGRIGYALVYDQSLLGLKFFQIWHGGMASHGGMLGIIFACWFSTRWLRTEELGLQPPLDRAGATLHVMDCMGLVSVFGIFLGRIANFVNAELLGRVVIAPSTTGELTPAPWWTVRFPQELSGWVEPGPPAVREMASHTPDLTVGQMAKLDALVQSVRQPEETWASALGYVIKHADRYRDQLEPLVSSRHPSQLYQAVAEGLVLGAIVWLIWRLPRKPGVVAAWWLMVYGALRVVTEVWRLPDAQFVGAAARPLGLSRGQWLSVGMVAIGLVLLIWAARRAGPKLGGWWRASAAIVR